MKKKTNKTNKTPEKAIHPLCSTRQAMLLPAKRPSPLRNARLWKPRKQCARGDTSYASSTAAEDDASSMYAANDSPRSRAVFTGSKFGTIPPSPVFWALIVLGGVCSASAASKAQAAAVVVSTATQNKAAKDECGPIPDP